MELRHLRYFLAVADSAHFRRAARSLQISQPTLSQQIQKLERELGTPLFERIGKRVRLTTAGETLRHHAQRVLHELDQAQVALHELDGLTRGKLAVGIVSLFGSYLLPPIVSRFVRVHPGVFLSVAELTAGQIEQDLLSGRLNLGISFVCSVGPAIDSQPLFEDEFVVIVSARHRLASRKRLRIRELDAEPLVLLPNAFWVRSLLDEKMREAGVRPHVAVEINSVEGILATVRGGGGATILPTLALANKETGLRTIKFTEPMLRRTVGVLWRRDGCRCRAADAFLEYARAAFQK